MPRRQPSRFRRHIRLAPAAYRSGEPFLVTICTALGTAPFRDPERAEIVAHRLRADFEGPGGAVVAFCVMPDHVHVILAGAADVVQWARTFKAALTARLRRRGVALPLWQRSFHDRWLRLPGGSLVAAVAYVLENPVRAGLAARVEDWAWSGVASG